MSSQFSCEGFSLWISADFRMSKGQPVRTGGCLCCGRRRARKAFRRANNAKRKTLRTHRDGSKR